MRKEKKTRKHYTKKKKNNRINSLIVISIVMIFMLVMGVRMYDMKQLDKELAQKEQKMEEALACEENRTTELEKQALYVQTKQYIEEAAKKLGFVYPDEIIFKPKN